MSLPIGAEREPCVTPALTPVLSARWALAWRHVGLVAGFCGLFLLLDLAPLGDSRVWLNVRQGRYMLEHHALPIADPVQPLAEGMPFVAAGWLTQVGLALADAAGGPQQVANVLAALGLLAAMILARVLYVRAGRLSLALAGLAITIVIVGSTLAPACPELTGIACFATLLWLAVKVQGLDAEPTCGNDQPSRIMWLVGPAVGVLFAAWANLHSSFFMGIGLLACFAVGRLLQVSVVERSLLRALGDRSVQRWILLVEGALVATLVNPYGVNLWLDVLGVNWQELLASSAGGLTLSSLPGAMFLLSLAALAPVFRYSRRRVQPAEVVLLAAFGAAVVVTGQAVPWYGIVFVFAVAPHVGHLVETRRERAVPWEPHRSFTASLACLLTVWCAFAFSPASQGLLGRARADGNPGLYKAFPWGVAEYLRSHPVQGLVFAPMRWTDGFVWACPTEMGFVMTSDAARVPRRVRNDCDNVVRVRPGWEQLLRKYNVDTLVIDKQRQPDLAVAASSVPRWIIDYEDSDALVVRRACVAPQVCPAPGDCCGDHQPAGTSPPPSVRRRGVSL